MNWPVWLQETLTLSLHLSQGQQLGLAFLLGSFAVATWSDLKYLSAQREFVEVWLFVVVCAFGYDCWRAHQGEAQGPAVVFKWALIAVLALISLKEVGYLFRLAVGDVAALAAAAGLLPPLWIVLLFVLAKAVSYAFAPVLRRGRNVYPFMPVVSAATLLVLAVGLASA